MPLENIVVGAGIAQFGSGRLTAGVDEALPVECLASPESFQADMPGQRAVSSACISRGDRIASSGIAYRTTTRKNFAGGIMGGDSVG